MLSLGEHCPSLRSVTDPGPITGEAKNGKGAPKRFGLQKGFQCESSLYWTKLEIVFWWKSEILQIQNKPGKGVHG